MTPRADLARKGRDTPMDLSDPAAVLKERDDVEAVFEDDTTVYVWNNQSIGHSGDFNPSLLELLAEFSRAGHGVLPVTPVGAKRAPSVGKMDRPPHLKILKDWSVRERMNRKPEGQ